MTTNLQKTILALFMVSTFPAWADHNNDSYPVQAYDDGRYDYAKVVDARPIVETVRVPEQRQVCRIQPVQRQVAEYRSPAPAIFGAILGGVIGNQLSRGHGDRHYRGHGNDRAAGTLAGAAIGGTIASGIQYSRYPAKYYTENVRVCGEETSWHTEERVVAWNVTWKYKGKIYHSTMDQQPGDRIPVRVSVNPVKR